MLPINIHKSSFSVSQGKGWTRLLTIAFLFMGVFLLGLCGAAEVNAENLNVIVVGNGSVSSVPAGINCPGDCSESYATGTAVSLTATVGGAGWEFVGWTGDVESSDNPLNITMDSNYNLTATFTQIEYTLNVTCSGGTGGGTDRVTKSPAQATYHWGDVVTLTAAPQAGETFGSWGGDLGGSANPDTITIDGNKNVTAAFNYIEYTLTVNTAGAFGTGTVTKAPDQATYHYGDVVTLTANPGTGELFDHWSGDLSGSTNPDTITIDGDKSVTANFDYIEYTLTVNTAGALGTGTVTKAPDQATYHYGDVVTLTANPGTGELFDHWSGDLSGSTNPDTITIDGDKSVTANFDFIEYTLTVNIAGAFSTGTVTKAPDQATYHYGDVVTLTANPGTWELFDHWSGDLSGSTNPDTITIDGDKSVTANFDFIEYTLTVNTAGALGTGTVTKAPDQATYHYGDVVTLTANPGTGELFDHWSGDLSGSTNPDTITIDGDKSVTANFDFIEYTLTVNIAGAFGTGTVTKAPDQATYHYGDVVTLTANPGTGELFDHWSGDLSGSTNPDTITIDGDKSVTANFDFIEYTLTVNIAGAFSTGTVTKAPDQATYHYGNVVTLTANPGTGELFDHWSGDLSGSTNPDTITIDGDKSVTANFDFIEYTLTVNTAGAFGTGTMTKAPDQATYHYGDVVTLTANPGTGELFDHWSGDLSGSTNPDAITIDGDKSVTANFDYIEYTLTTSVIGSGSGTVDKSPDQATYHYGDVVQLTANPAPNPGGGSIFKGWSGDLTGSTNPASLTIHAGTNTVTAEFAQTWIITATAGANGIISPSGAVQVEEGSDQLFTFDPNTCHEVDDVLWDVVNSEGGEIREYTFTNVIADHSINVQFYHYDCTITATAEYGGTITPSGVQTVSCGDSRSFTIQADTTIPGNEIAEVLVDGSDLGIGTGITTYVHDWTDVRKGAADTSPCVHYIVAKFTRAASSCLDISDIPLNAMSRSAPANIMFVLDDSGSMDWEIMTNESDGKFDVPGMSHNCVYVFDNPGDNNYNSSTYPILNNTGRRMWKSQCSDYNKMYYNPNIEYRPWPTLNNADPDDLRSHPYPSHPDHSDTFALNGNYVSINGAIIVDDSDANFSKTGPWSSSSHSDAYNNDYWWTPSSNAYAATWTVNPPAGGQYQVYARWYGNANRSTAVPYTINHSVGASTVNVNQRNNSGVWNLLGTYTFNAGSGSVTVTYSPVGTSDQVCADAVKFIPTTSTSISVKNAHYYAKSASHGRPYLVVIDGEIKYYAVDDVDNDGVVDNEELIQTASAPADVKTGRSYIEERQNFANWYSFYRRRELTATAAVSNVVDNMQGVQIGFYSIHNRVNQEVLKVKVGTADETNTLLQTLYMEYNSSGGTPLRRGLEAVGRYFHQDDNQNGGIGTSPYASVADGGECQQSFAIVMTDGYWNGDPPYTTAIVNNDGDDDSDYDGAPYADNYSDTLADVAMYYYENDLSDENVGGLGDDVPPNAWDKAPHQHMVTYGISFGVTGTLDPSAYDFINTFPTWPNPASGAQQKIDDLWHASVNGRGIFLSASNPNELVNTLLEIMQNIEEREGSASSVSVNGDELYTKLSGGGDILMFQSSYDTENWTGDVKAYQVCTDLSGNCAGKKIGDIIRTPYVWSAEEKLNSLIWTNRKIVTYNGTNAGTAFRWSDLTTDQQTALNNEDLLNYLRGDASNELANLGSFRDRFGRLGDMVHSSPTFENGVLYAGGNDGMLHAFAAADGEPYALAVGGEELFAYVPNLVFDNLSQLADTNYTHKYFVDLTPTVKAGVDISNVSTTVLVGGLGKGGRGYYALDVTDPTSWASESNIAGKVMWEYPNASVPAVDIDDLGYSFSKPAIVKCNDPNVGWIVIFGNGYNSQNGHAVLYILNPETGVIIRKIDTGVDGCNGLSTAVPIDVDYDNKVDYVYAGDLRGNVWKFDLTDPDYNNWKVAFYDGEEKPLFQAQGPGGTTQPITAKPDVMYHPTEHGYMVLFGTGQYLGESDISETTAQSFYGIWDYGDDEDDKEYLGSFRRGYGQELSNQPSTVSLLAQQVIPSEESDPNFWTVTLTDGAGNPYDLLLRLTTDHDIVWETVSDKNNDPSTDPLDDLSDSVDNHAGWYFDLPLSGERGTVDMMVRGGIIIAISFIPEDTPCGYGGDSVIHEMNAASGARLTRPQFDINGDGVIDDDDMINIGTDLNPIWVVPTGMKKAGQLQPPAILIDPDRGVEIKYFSSSSGTIETVYEKPPLLGISHWREFE